MVLDGPRDSDAGSCRHATRGSQPLAHSRLFDRGHLAVHAMVVSAAVAPRPSVAQPAGQRGRTIVMMFRRSFYEAVWIGRSPATTARLGLASPPGSGSFKARRTARSARGPHRGRDIAAKKRGDRAKLPGKLPGYWPQGPAVNDVATSAWRRFHRSSNEVS